MPGPLDGITIVDLTQVVSGPFAGMFLADQGADIIKVEPLTGAGDISRLPAFSKNDMGAFYVNLNRGKRGLGLDLGTEEARQIVLELCRDADVFMQNFRPGAIDRLGLGYDAVRAVNEDIVYVSISGFGPDGPYADRPVLDPVIQGLCGIPSRQLNPNIPFPDLIRNFYADKSTGLTVAQAVTAALFVRASGGGGQAIEIPMLDSCLYFFWPDGMADLTMLDDDVSGGTLLSTVYNLTECSDGNIVYFAATDAQRQGLCTALGHPEWAEDERFATLAAMVANPENFELLGRLLNEAFLQLTCEQAITALVDADVPAGPVLTGPEVLEDPQVVHNEILVEWEHPDGGRIRQPRHPVRFEGTPTELVPLAAQRGQHNDEVLAALGHSPDEIAGLRNRGVIG